MFKQISFFYNKKKRRRSKPHISCHIMISPICIYIFIFNSLGRKLFTPNIKIQCIKMLCKI